METIETFSTGYEVKCRSFALHFGFEIREKFVYPALPEKPMKRVKSPAGQTEDVPYADDAPEMVAYQAALAKYAQEYTKVRREAERAANDFALDWVIVAWRLPPDETWHTEPPDGWKLDPVAIRHGIKPNENNRRIDFIKSEIISDPSDSDIIYRLKQTVTPEAAILAADEEFKSPVSNGSQVTRPASKRARHNRR